MSYLSATAKHLAECMKTHCLLQLKHFWKTTGTPQLVGGVLGEHCDWLLKPQEWPGSGESHGNYVVCKQLTEPLGDRTPENKSWRVSAEQSPQQVTRYTQTPVGQSQDQQASNLYEGIKRKNIMECFD